MTAHVLLFNLLFWVAFFHGEVGLDLKVDTTSLKTAR